MVLPFDGGPQEQALRAQHVLVEQAGDQFVVRAPVTQRGEAIGLLEIALPAAPTEDDRADRCRAPRTPWPSW